MNFDRRHFIRTAAAVSGTAIASSFCRPRNALAQPPTVASSRGLPPTQDNDHVQYHRLDEPTLMVGFPPEERLRVTVDNYATSIAKARWAQQNTPYVFKTIRVDRGDPPIRLLERCTVDPEKLNGQKVLWGTSDQDSRKVKFMDWLHMSMTDAFVVLHRGSVVTEHYFGLARPDSRHLLWSCGKGPFACLVLQELARGGGLNEGTLVRSVVPELSSAFEGATVRHLLDQVTGIDFKMFPSFDDDPVTVRRFTFGTSEYQNAKHGMPKFSRTAGLLPRHPKDPKNSGLYDFLIDESKRVGKPRNHGDALWYTVLNELALQLVLERTAKRPFTELLSENLWGKLGVENHMYAVVDVLGTPANSGLAITARDAARFCQMLLEDGRVGNQQVVPADAVRDLVSYNNSDKINERSNMFGIAPARAGYRSLFWSYPDGESENTFINAVGFRSQHCFIDPMRQNVIIKFSSNPNLAEIANDIVALKSFSRLLPNL